MSNFPGKMKSLRIERDMTQEKLATILNVSQNAVYNWENGKRQPSLEMIRKIAAALGVCIGDLVDDWSKFSKDEIANDWKYGLPLDELRFLQDYRILNDTGKNEARKRVNELTELSKYQKYKEK